MNERGTNSYGVVELQRVPIGARFSCLPAGEADDRPDADTSLSLGKAALTLIMSKDELDDAIDPILWASLCGEEEAV